MTTTCPSWCTGIHDKTVVAAGCVRHQSSNLGTRDVPLWLGRLDFEETGPDDVFIMLGADDGISRSFGPAAARVLSRALLHLAELAEFEDPAVVELEFPEDLD